jgi:hypothetical protein
MSIRTPLATAVGFAHESTPGTPVSRSVWARPLSVTGFTEIYEYMDIETLAGLGGFPDIDETLRLNAAVSGKIVLPYTYDGGGLMLNAGMMTTVSSDAGTPYNHDWERGTSVLFRTIEVIRGDSGNSEIFSGCFVPGFKINFPQGKMATIEYTVIGFKATADRTTAGTPSYVAFADLETNAVATQDSSDFTWNSASYDVHRSFAVEVTNNLSLVRKTSSRFGISAVRGRRGKVVVSASRLEDGDALYNAHRNGTQSDLQIDLTGTGNLAGQFLLRGAKPVGYSPGGLQPGEGIQEGLNWMGHGSASNSGLRLRLTNDSSSGTAN